MVKIFQILFLFCFPLVIRPMRTWVSRCLNSIPYSVSWLFKNSKFLKDFETEKRVFITLFSKKPQSLLEVCVGWHVWRCFQLFLVPLTFNVSLTIKNQCIVVVYRSPNNLFLSRYRFVRPDFI